MAGKNTRWDPPAPSIVRRGVAEPGGIVSSFTIAGVGVDKRVRIEFAFFSDHLEEDAARQLTEDIVALIHERKAHYG